jgi:branched-chain amino acid transport system permease protein
MTDLAQPPIQEDNGGASAQMTSLPEAPLSSEEEQRIRDARRQRSAEAFTSGLKGFAVTLAVASGLLLPLLGLKTEAAPGGLTLLPRIDLAMYLAFAIAGVRLAADIIFWRGATMAAHRAAAVMALLAGAALGVVLDVALWNSVAALADAAAGPKGSVPGVDLHFGPEFLRQSILLVGRATAPVGLGLATLWLYWRSFIGLGVLIVSIPYVARLALGRLALGAVIAAGGSFYLMDGARARFIEAAPRLLGDAAAVGAWGERLKISATLLSIVAMGVFLVVAAMLAARVVRLVTGIASGRLDPPKPDLDSQTEALWSRLGREFAPGLLMIAAVLPLLAAGPQQRYAVDTATQVMTYVMLGWGLNVVVGLAGLLDLGYVAFYAVGAYSYALLAANYDWSFWTCLPAAGLLAALWGVVLGFPVLRLRGDYLAIVTMAFGEIIRVVLINWTSLTNGSNGLSVPKLTFFGHPFDAMSDNSFAKLFGIEHSPIHRVIFLYYLILVLALITNFVTVRLRRLPIGRAWEALREDEIACRALGLNTTAVKLSAFATGAMFGGLAGAFYAAHHGFINPESFTFNESALILAIVVLGGMGSQTGVVIAAVVLIGSFELFRELAEYRMLIFGGAMVAIMTWKPRGLISHRTATATLKENKAIGGDFVSQGQG